MLFSALHGTVVNGIAIIAGAAAGALLGRFIPSRFSEIMMQGIGLAVIVIGLQMALQAGQVVLLIISLILGGVAGELLNLEEKLLALGRGIERRAGGKQSRIAQAFVYATLIYGVGAMAVTGALESGLAGKHQILYAKAVLDGVSAVVFASALGAGVALSAVPVVIYQGGIALAASWVSAFLTEAVIVELSAVGGLLIVAIGLNLLRIKTLKVGNFLPALVFNALLMHWLG